MMTRGSLQDIAVRDYRRGDEVAINALFNLVFRRSRTLGEWRWKFEGSAKLSGGPVPVTVAETDGRIIGQWARLVIPFQVRGRVVMAVQVVDNAVHPDFRAGGYVQCKLVAAQPALAHTGGVAFAFGFPDETACLMGKMMRSYWDVASLPTLSRPLCGPLAMRRRFPAIPGWLAAIASRVAPLLYRGVWVLFGRRGIAIRQVSAFDARLDTLWNSAREGYGILAVRNRQFLAWRYDSKPSGGYAKLVAKRAGTVVGYAVLKLKQADGARFGVIVDLLTVKDRDVESAVIRGAMDWSLKQAADSVLCRILREDRLHARLLQHGFQEDPDFPAVPVVCYGFSEQLDQSILTDPRHWHLTFGDSDDV